MKTSLVLASTAVAAALLFVVTKSAAIPADQYSTNVVSKETFTRISGLLSNYKKKNIDSGVTYAEGTAADTFAMYCHDLPLVMLTNGPGAMTMLVFVDYSRRSPGLENQVDEVLEAMRKEGDVSLSPGAKSITEVDQFVLKYRDGIDLGAECLGDPRTSSAST